MTTIDSKELNAAARGKWLGIFSALGIKVPEPPGTHGPCPICGEGTDRFRLDPDSADRGTYLCSQCAVMSGDGLTLVQLAFGLSFPEALKAVADVIGHIDITPTKQLPQRDPKIAIRKIWKASAPLTGSDRVSQYLRSRKLVLTTQDLRYCPACYESETKTKMPAMIAMVKNRDGKCVTLHRTYLAGASKAAIKSPKKLLTPTCDSLAYVGASVRLFPADDVVGVSEGIETAIACTQLFEIPTWAAISTKILEGFEPPEGIRKVVIFGDNDANFAGQKAAYKLANKLYLKDCIVDVQIPETVGDWADEI